MGWFDRKIYFYFQHSHALTLSLLSRSSPAAGAPLLLELPCFRNSVTPSLLSSYLQLRESQKKPGVFPGLVFRLETKGSALYSL